MIETIFENDAQTQEFTKDESSAVAKIGLSEDNKKMHFALRSGYGYEVTQDNGKSIKRRFTDWKKADSKGRFFLNKVKNNPMVEIVRVYHPNDNA